MLKDGRLPGLQVPNGSVSQILNSGSQVLWSQVYLELNSWTRNVFNTRDLRLEYVKNIEMAQFSLVCGRM